MRPACSRAASPEPQKKSPRTTPLMAPPTSCATTRPPSGLSVAGHVVSSQRGTPTGSRAAAMAQERAVGDGLGEEEVVASLLLHATGLLQGRLAGAPEEVAAHDTLDGAADILRDHEAAQRLVGGRPGGVEPERHAERQQGGVDG